MTENNPYEITLEGLFTNRKIKELNRKIYHLSDKILMLEGRVSYLEEVIRLEFPHHNYMNTKEQPKGE